LSAKTIDILYTLDSASLLVKLKPRILRGEREVLLQNKKSIVERITHIIDCEGYSGQHKTYLREVSVYDIKNDMCVNFDVRPPCLGF
jgi:hypothetical protein